MAEARAVGVAFDLFRAREPLAAAIVCANLLGRGVASAELYAALGASLLDARGVIVRKPFEAWAAKVFARGMPLLAGSDFADVVRERLADIPDGTRAEPLRDDEVPEMIAFLVVNEQVLPDAIAALPADDRMGAVMALGDLGDELYVQVLRAAIVGRYGDGAARSALKRIGGFIDRVDVQGSLAVAAASSHAEELGPYLTFVLDRLPAGWDAPRTAACPPYEGIGGVELELTGAGPDRARCVEILCERLGASPHDARSWVDHAPCAIKRGRRAPTRGCCSAR